MITYSPIKIIDLRLKLGLKQSELARRAGLSAPTVWALEKGDTKMPKFDTLKALADALGVPIPRIMADEQPSDIDAQLIAAIGILTPANKGAILGAILGLVDTQKKP